MKRHQLHKIKLICDGIVHCGDYGKFYANKDLKEVLVVLGDADICDLDELEREVKNAGAVLTVSDESGPYPEDNYILISCGIEAEYPYKEYPEDADLEDGYVIPKLLLQDEYSKYWWFISELSYDDK